MPFANQLERDIHFQKHGHKFGITSPTDYETMADAFLFGVMRVNTKQCIRPTAIDRLRFNDKNRHFGVARINPVYVRTFYPVSIVKIARHRGTTEFFAFECARIDL